MRDANLMARMAFVSTVIFGFYLLLVRAGMAVGLGLPTIVGGLVVFVAVQYWVGTRGVVRQVGAVPIPEDDFAAFVEEYERAATEMGFSEPPKLLVAEMGVPNAFAVGRKGNGTIVVSAELLELLDFEEAGAVLTHELAHLDNRDSILMVVGESVSTIVGLTVMVVLGASDSLVLDLVAYLLGLLAKFLVTLFVLALSRYREYAADRDAAAVLRSGEPLARALAKIERVGDRGADVPANVSALCIAPADDGILATVLSTHPSTEKRIERLQSL